MADGPFSGVLVLDLSRVLAGPFCTMMLAELGARVIKVETPDGGDDSRRFEPFFEGQSAYFASLNRGKESIALDLKNDGDRAVFLQLVRRADVLVENFRPGTMERLGFSYEPLRAINPRLIYAAVSGFGQTGPWGRKPAYDLIAQALGGMMSVTGRPGDPPTKAGTSIGDLTGGLFLLAGIAAALYDREKTGLGRQVDVALFDGQLAILESAIMRYAATGQVPGPMGNRHPSITPFEPFAAADRLLVLAAGNDVLFGRLCQALGRPELAVDPRFVDNRQRTHHAEELKIALEQVLCTAPAAHWIDVLEAAGVPCSFDPERRGGSRSSANAGPQHGRPRRRAAHGRQPHQAQRLRGPADAPAGPRTERRRRTHSPRIGRRGKSMKEPISAADVPGGRRAVIEAVIASTVGTTIEWYDFFLYGVMAALVFPRLFFPSVDPFVGQILSFATYTTGFVARPLGGALFGYLGDRVGRKSTLVATLLLMGVSTMSIGFLPTADRLGVAAPFLLTFLRFVQGIGVGGEWGGAVLLALEYGHRGKRGFYASWPQAGVPLGLLTSAGVVALFQDRLAPEHFLAWGWRVPFFLSGLLIVVGLLIRMRILETPLFQQLQQTQQVSRAPVAETLRRHWREVLLAAGSRLSENSCFYLFSTYVLAYGKDILHVEERQILLAINVAAAIEFFTIPLWGILSDYWSRKGMFLVGSLVLIGFAGPYYYLLNTRQPAAILTAVIVSLAVGHAMLYSVQASLIPELFGTRLRYTGASLGYQLAAPVAGGTAPLVAATLAHHFSGRSWPLAAYLMGLGVVSLICVHFLAETSRKDLAADGD